MEKSKITYNNIVTTNISKSLILSQNFSKSRKNEDLIGHYESIKNTKKERPNILHKIRLSNTLYTNNSKIKQKMKNMFYSPGRRINSTKLNPDKVYKKLHFLTITNDDASDGSTKKRKKNFKKLNAYYYSSNIPIKNKYIVDSLSQGKSKTNKKEKKNRVSVVQQKIDSLARNLNLFQYKHKNNNLKNVQNPFSRKLEKITNNRESIHSYNSRQNDFHNSTKSTIPTKYLQQSFFDKTNYSKNNQRSSFILPNDNVSNINIKSRELTEKKEVNKEEIIKDDNNNNNKIKNIMELAQKEKEKKIMKNAQINVKYMDEKDEFLYKKIFLYNNINRKKRSPSVIDNKLNIFYCENISQYNQKMNKINDILAKRGKPMIHQGVERNSQKNMERILKKIQFMKKVVDYVYPNMVLYKVKQENKRASNTKSLDFKYSRSQINLLNLKEEKKKIDSYFGSSMIINNH